MLPNCFKCEENGESGSKVRRDGRFFRHSTASWVPRYRCSRCKTGFSAAIFEDAYRQKKRFLNPIVAGLLSGTMSQNEAARFLKINRKTVVRKFLHMAQNAKADLRRENLAAAPARVVVFDDLETHENTRFKPLSVTIAVDAESRRILGLEISPMPERGRLAKRAREKYGPRKDQRRAGRTRLFQLLQEIAEPDAEFYSDANPQYPPLLRRHFPQALHKRYLGKRGAATGQGELKKLGFDPIFGVNLVCAMLRAHVNRLIRRTWCTTKRIDRLESHLLLYAAHFNRRLREREQRKADRSKLLAPA